MNYSTAILLINPACRAIKAIYEPDPTDENRPRAKRTLFKTFDRSIKAGDIAMVPSTTRHMVTTVKVTDVDVEWDVHSCEEVKWVIGVIDQAEYISLKSQEEAAIKAFLKQRMYRHQRVMRVMGEAEGILFDLFARYQTSPGDLPAEWVEGTASETEPARARRIGNFIAGMTDRFALMEHQRLFDSTPDLR